MIYQWKDGFRSSLDAQTIGVELERIRTTNNGRLEKEMVVIEAQSPDSPLHSAFEWDDTKAAHEYRCEQSRYIIRNIQVTIPESHNETPIRAFVSVQRDSDISFTSIVHAMSDEDLRAQVVASAWRELEAWHSRHAELVEFAKVFSAIDQARSAK